LLTDEGFELGNYKDGVSEGEFMDFNLIRFHQTALKQLLPDFYADVNLFQYMKPAAGLGLRVMIQKQSRTNLTIDYGWGADGEAAFYSLCQSFHSSG